MHRPALVAALLPALLFCACATEAGTTFFKTTPNFYPTAQKNYEHGLKELKAGNWQTAESFFKHVRSSFGFSRWATLSELGLADAEFGRDRFIEAIDGYKGFMKAHPGNERVQDGYTSFRIGLSYYRQIPGDFFILPPAYEKDQGAVIDAMRELSAFVEQYADSPYAKEAHTLITKCVKRLTDHEIYVARYYLDNNHPYAAVGRLEGVIRSYPASQREPEILLLLGKTYLKMDKLDEARATFEKLATDHADDFRAGKAKLYIDYIDKRRTAKL